MESSRRINRIIRYKK